MNEGQRPLPDGGGAFGQLMWCELEDKGVLPARGRRMPPPPMYRDVISG